jgi:hypothetical protein
MVTHYTCAGAQTQSTKLGTLKGQDPYTNVPFWQELDLLPHLLRAQQPGDRASPLQLHSS